MGHLDSRVVSSTPWLAMGDSSPVPSAKYSSPLSSAKKTKGGGIKPINAFKNTVFEFAGTTTIHGIAYIFDRAILALERLLWFIAVGAFAGLAIYWSYDAWKTWQESPVLTSVKSTGKYLV